MIRSTVLSFAIAFCAIAAACHRSTDPTGPVITTQEVAGDARPQFDTATTYFHRYAQSNPDSLMRLLHAHGIPVVRGWLSLEYLCMDAMGPRFTVELARDDARILSLDFLRGDGLHGGCTRRARLYTLR